MQLGIIKNFFIISGVQIFRLGSSLLQNKLIALFFDTRGMGIWNLLQTFLATGTTLVNVALPGSGCRCIANAKTQKEKQATLKAFFALLIFFALFLSAIGIFFSKEISSFLFDSPDYVAPIRIIWLAIAISALAQGIIGIVNGCQLLRAYSLIHIVGFASGTVLVVCGLLLARSVESFAYLILGSSLALFASCLFFLFRQRILQRTQIERNEIVKSGKSILYVAWGAFGATALSSIMTICSKAFLSHYFGLHIVGLYQASWTVSSLYIGLFIMAMGVDFIPRATKLIDSPAKLNALVNDQLQFGVLLSSIGIVAVISFCDFILYLLYSKDFIIAKNIIRWQILGVSLRIIAFPFTYSLIAMAKSFTYFIVQAVFWVGEFLLLVLISVFWGFDGLGINYFLGYCVYAALVVAAGIRFFHFRPCRMLKRILLFSFSCFAAAWLNSIFIPSPYRFFLAIALLFFMIVLIYRFTQELLSASPWKILKEKILGMRHASTESSR